MKDKKKIISMSLASILLLMILVGATYAYFKAQTGNGANVPTQVTTNTTDSLVLETGTDISITADMSTFAEGMDNRTGTSFARATLKANNKTNSASRNYYVYFDVTKNELKYTTEEHKPELLLKITGPDNQEVTTGIEGVEFKTVTDGKGNVISGFDITEYSGLLTIVNNKEITSTSETVEKYDIEVILINLDDDQTSNGGKSFAGSLKIQKEKYTLAEACQNKELGSCIVENYELDVNIYYHKNLANSAEDGSYRYAGSYEKVNNYVCFGTDATTCDNDHLYRIIGVFENHVKLIKADFPTIEQLGITEQNGTDAKSSYPNYNGTLTEIPRYYWSGSSSNQVNSWASSSLNTNALNTNFANSIGTTWMSKIATTNWKVGGNTWENIGTQNAQTSYINEIINSVIGQTEVSNKIGLMYVSDYMYGASPTYWTYLGYTDSSYPNASGQYGESYDYRAATRSNWMYSGVYEWTISRRSDVDHRVFFVGDNGIVANNNVYNYFGVRPVFYLNSDVKKFGGNGTPENPYRVS